MGETVRIWCLRHGQSANVVARAAGVLPYAPLTAVGEQQARAAAALLAAEPVTAVYSSTAVRARATAAPLTASFGTAAVVVRPELDEIGIGAAEGATDPATRARTAAVLRAWVVDGELGERVADGEDGYQVLARVTSVLDAIATAHPGGTVVVVGHVGSLTLGLSVLCGLGARVWGEPLPHAVPLLIEHTGAGWRCADWPGLATAPTIPPPA